MFFLSLAPVSSALLPALALPLHHVLCSFPIHPWAAASSPCTLQPSLCHWRSWKQGQYGLEWGTPWWGGREQSKCDEFRELYIQGESNSSRSMMYGGDGTVIPKAVTSTKRLITTFPHFHMKYFFFFFTSKQNNCYGEFSVWFLTETDVAILEFPMGEIFLCLFHFKQG